MKHKILTCLICFSFFLGFSQEKYTVNNETLELKSEVSGNLELLWNTFNGTYRYFLKKGSTIQELVNTKVNGKYQEEYKQTLQKFTPEAIMKTEKVKLTLASLSNFVSEYNEQTDSNFKSTKTKRHLKTRLGVFGGITNVPFVVNPNNETATQLFAELEVFDDKTLQRHSLFFRTKFVLENDETNYSTTQLGLGYRFKIIKSQRFNFYSNITFATLNFSSSKIATLNTTTNTLETREISETSFDAPLIFGIGLDYRLTNNLYLALDYDELFAVFLKNQGNFSKHLALGLKLNL